MLGLAEAQERLLALASPMPICELPVEQALGHFLAWPIHALRTQPAHPLSAMDGWALRQSDMPGPWRVVGESAAGRTYAGAINPGEAIRISTGAIVPNNADMVLVQEDCTREGETLAFHGTPPAPLDRHIRKPGLDFADGQIVLQAGEKITPARLALAISAGHAALPVRRVPSITVIDSGDELVPAGQPLAEGQIPASNGPMLAAMLASLPCKLRRIGPVADQLDAVVAALNEAGDADLIITSGGASVGDHDFVRPALEAIGAKIDFWRVAIKPGKPIMIARRVNQLVLGLPGNPVSTFVTASLFALPLVRAILGSSEPLPAIERIVTASALPATRKRAEFPRGRVVQGRVEHLSTQDSGALFPLALANALIVRPPHATAVSPGEIVEILRIGD